MPRSFSLLLRQALSLTLVSLCSILLADAQTTTAGTPHFSRQSGTFVDNFALALTGASPNGVIRYTTNGAVPDATSLLYSGPILVTNSVQIRAVNLEPGLTPSASASESYVKLDASLLDFQSDLPLVVVDNFKRGAISTAAQPAFFAIFDRSNGSSALVNSPTVATRAGINIRGSSTLDQIKHNYAIETWDEQNSDKKIEPLGMPADSDWILYAPYNFDRANLRNPFIYELSNQVGRYAVRTRFVEVFVNTSGGSLRRSHYAGIYVFMEKIKRGVHRVDVEKLTPPDVVEPEVTGGYMVKIDRLAPGDHGMSVAGEVFAFVDPKEKQISMVQSNWIKSYIVKVYSSLNVPAASPSGTSYGQYVDVNSWIDHHLLNEFTKNPDGLRLSTFLFKQRGEKLSYGPIWDFDRTMGCDDDSRAANPVGWSDDFNYNWWARIFRDPDFYQRYIDRWHELRQGAMTVENMQAIIDSMAAEIQNAEPRDAQRWRMVPNLAGWQGKVSKFKEWIARRAAWIDSQWIPAPALSLPGGLIQPGFQVQLSTGLTNTIYYTLDGSDPRMPGGAVSPGARVFQPAADSVALTRTTQLIARSRNARTKNPWSAPTQAIFALEDFPQLALTEVMYNPLPPPAGSPFNNEDFEFVEFQNIGSTPLNLVGFHLDGGVHFTFPHRELLPGETILVVRSLAAFSTRYDAAALNIAGEYQGHLGNSGDTLLLKDSAGRLIVEFSYHDGGAWPKGADGKGRSLEIQDPHADYNESSNWRASNEAGGTPGRTSFTRIEVERVLGDRGAKLSFRREPGKSYSIYFREQLGSGTWQLLRIISATPEEGASELLEPLGGESRFYRLSSP